MESFEEVSFHVQRQECPGKPSGVQVNCLGALSGFIRMREVSDTRIRNPSERLVLFLLLYFFGRGSVFCCFVSFAISLCLSLLPFPPIFCLKILLRSVAPGQAIRCRVLEINPSRFSVELSCKGSTLRDDVGMYSPAFWGWDVEYFDFQAMEADRLAAAQPEKTKKGKQYIRRAVDHPSFQNVTYREATKAMQNKLPGEIIIRPSSKGEDHLTITWKVTPTCMEHVDVRELVRCCSSPAG